MEDFERRKIQKAIEEIDTTILELRIQVLNNVDAQMGSAGNSSSIRTFIKQPIVLCINRLSVQKLNLMKLLSPGPQPATKPLNQTGGPLTCLTP